MPKLTEICPAQSSLQMRFLPSRTTVDNLGVSNGQVREQAVVECP